MVARALRVLAGPEALRELHLHGFDPARIGTIAGASGGPKWLVLGGLDKVLAEVLLPQLAAPVDLIGSSIGTWRFACLAQDKPLEAIGRFERAYVEQRYRVRPDRSEISVRSEAILDEILGADGARQILQNTRSRTHIMTVRSRGLNASESPVLLAAGLAFAAAGNLFSRSTLAASYSRALFHDERSDVAFLKDREFGLQRVHLTEQNLAPAILASGSIPLVLNGIPDIPGARTGIYRDGGVIDYHLDLQFSESDRLTLYPHFYPTVVPGWFDKNLRARHATPSNFRKVILLAPSQEFVAALPGGRIPDRSDFTALAEDERIDRWREVVSKCERLGEEFNELLVGERLASVAEPLNLRRR